MVSILWKFIGFWRCFEFSGFASRLLDVVGFSGIAFCCLEKFYILERLWFYGSGLLYLEVGWFSESALGFLKVVSVWWIFYAFACVLVFWKCFLFSESALVLWKCLGFCGSLYRFLEEF